MLPGRNPKVLPSKHKRGITKKLSNLASEPTGKGLRDNCWSHTTAIIVTIAKSVVALSYIFVFSSFPSANLRSEISNTLILVDHDPALALT